MLNFLEKSVRQKGINFIRIDGSTSNRQQLIDQFNEGRAQVALCSLKAAGHGINMTGANHVIHADRWWNPATEDQATDRVHRIGQDKTVYVYRILVENTIEERIDTLLEKKRDIADQIVGAATEGPSQWSREELIDLLSPLDKFEETRDSSQRVRRRTSQEAPDTTRKPTEEKVSPQPKRSSRPETKSTVPDGHQVPERPKVPTAQAPLSERLVYIVALSDQADVAAVQELVDILDSPDNNIRWLAGSSLMRIGGPQVVSTLSGYLKRHDATELGQLEAIKVLGKIGDSLALEVLERISSDKNVAEPIRIAAANSIKTYTSRVGKGDFGP